MLARMASRKRAAPRARRRPQRSSLREREQQKRAATAPGQAPAAPAAQEDDVAAMADKTGEPTQEELHILNHELLPMSLQP
ncbi:MAG: hypothetical protein RL033_333 [Pseudomonadota bacterium]|jgi:hypothetical protein